MNTTVQYIKSFLEREFGHDPWVCMLATTDEAARPTVRCMVLREIDTDGQLWFVSDRRTRKDDHLRARPDTEVCFWLPRQQVQIRIRGRATVMDAQTDQFFRQMWWDRLSDANRRIFRNDETDSDPSMPGTFELLSVTPTEIELQDLSDQDNVQQVWKVG
ncbi:MAG: hypothetical protein KatS3mg104_2092 [Phycisphaerae bacterium]|jgi:general stress protein 26|nr:MAG: hypothetical protein KatS3mg104_2092 [Phycisphaerae bacterium]